AAEKWLEIGRQENTHRPAAAAGGRLHESHIYAIHVRALLAVHFDVHEILVHQFRDLCIFKRLVSHDVTPMARRISDREKDGLFLAPRLLERLRTPRI